MAKEFDRLPPVMRKRAEWAREQIIKHPDRSQVDHDEMLAWVFNEEDNLWYSIDGNYSQSSPEEKMRKRQDWAEKREEYQQSINTRVLERIADQEYWSRIREKILLRDSYTCQLCGAKSTTKLHIHHIIKRADGGKDYDDLLITVCPKCHAQADRKLYNPQWEI